MKAMTIALCLPVLALGACVVVPVGPDGRPYAHAYPAAQTQPAVALIPVAPQPVTLSARLYPLNSAAQGVGLAVGQVQNYLDGKGSFSILIGAEQFTGEATRATRNGSAGIASAVGNRGTGMNCTYNMNLPTQGSGRCTLSTGGEFQLHLGS